MFPDHFSIDEITLVLAHGEPPSVGLMRSFYERAQSFIALDGASSWAIEQGFSPHLIIGDMDSTDPSLLQGYRVIRDADQETNDLAKAFAYCERNALKTIVVLGAFGLRSDHFLTNIYAAKQFAKSLDILLMHDQELAFFCPLNQELHFTKRQGAYLSLFPLDGDVGPVTLTGVDYPLDREFLSLHRRLGTLNRINSHKASLCCEKGPLLVMLPSAQDLAKMRPPLA